MESLSEEIGQLKVNGAELNGTADKESRRKHINVEKAMRPLGAPYRSQQNECSVQSCFTNFTAPEFLSGNNKFNCRYCSKTDGKIFNNKKNNQNINFFHQKILNQPFEMQAKKF